MSTNEKYMQDLAEHFLTAKDPESMNKILHGILTPSELIEISKRLQIFRLLESGMPQRQIAEKLGVGIATVTRGSRALKNE